MISITDYFDIFCNLLIGRSLRRLNFAPRPRVLAYTVSWRCNAGCEMCGIRDVDRALKNKDKELSAADIARTFKDPLLGGLDLIRFTGGEPFLKEDFTGIVEAIISNTKTKVYYITTNGFYSERIFAFVERLAPKTKNLVIQISLDGIGKIHDDIRKIPGLYDKVVHTLNGLKKLKEKYSFSFGVNQTVTADTSDQIEGVSELCKDLGCDHKVYLAHETHESDIMEGAKHDTKLSLIDRPDKAALERLYAQVEGYYNNGEKRSKNLTIPEILWDVLQKHVLRGSKNRLLKDEISPNPPCLSMFFYLRLLPDGTVMPCTLKPVAIGNVKEQTFNEVWNSKTAQEMRKEVRNCQGCWVECDIAPNLIYSFPVVKEIIKRFFKRGALN